MRYLQRFINEVKKHRDYDGLPIGIKNDILVVLNKVEDMKKELLEAYKNESLQILMETMSIGQYDGSDHVSDDYLGLFLENRSLGDDLHQNICFMNSVMQCLFAMPQFVQVIDQLDQQFGARF